MSTSSLVPRARSLRVPASRTSLRSVAWMLCAASGLCLAQEKGVVAPSTGLQAGPLQNIRAMPSKEAGAAIVGTWGNSRTDKETRENETTIIVFKPDGTYATRLRNTMFPEWEKFPMAGGRYAVTAADKAGFTLVLDRTSGDQEEDKTTARTTMLVSIIDDNTLRAPDGAVLTRIK